jgi:hypothetical protein
VSIAGLSRKRSDLFEDALVICNLLERDLDCDKDITPVRPTSELSEGIGQLF